MISNDRQGNGATPWTRRRLLRCPREKAERVGPATAGKRAAGRFSQPELRVPYGQSHNRFPSLGRAGQSPSLNRAHPNCWSLVLHRVSNELRRGRGELEQPGRNAAAASQTTLGQKIAFLPGQS